MNREKMDSRCPLVSVVIPVYNVGGFLEPCLESVLGQTYKNLEVLLMEGKSDDNSLDICVKWAKSDTRISLVSRKDGGLGPARNFGIDMAQGQYIFFVDSDDCLPLDAVETLVDMMQRDSRIDIAAGSYCSIDEAGVRTGCTNLLYEGCDREIEGKEEKERYIRRGVASAWGKLYRTELWKRSGIRMPSVLAEDSAVFPSLVVMADKIVCTDKITYFYRNRADSLFVCASRHLTIYEFIYCYCDYLKSKGLFDEYRSALFRFTYIHLMAWRDRLKPLIPDREEYEKKVEIPFSNAVQECFGVELITDRRILSIGSYNLRFICHRVHPQKGDIHTAFTTTVSQFYNFQAVVQELYHDNSFRQLSLVNDREKKVYQDLANTDSKIKLIIIDFLDDVTDIAVLEDGGILTGPTIFGANNGSLLGGGEAGREAVLPLSELWSNMRSVVAGVVGSAVPQQTAADGGAGMFDRINQLVNGSQAEGVGGSVTKELYNTVNNNSTVNKTSKADNSDNSSKLVFSPQITIQGNASKEDVTSALQMSQADFERMYAEHERQKGRTAFAT